MKHIINAEDAPKAIGPYSQAIKVSEGSLVFISGQIPLNPKTMTIEHGDVENQCRQVLDNLLAIIIKSGGQITDVIKTTIYLTNMGDFARVNEIYQSFFKDHKPARVTVAVAALPKASLVEIDATLCICN